MQYIFQCHNYFFLIHGIGSAARDLSAATELTLVTMVG